MNFAAVSKTKWIFGDYAIESFTPKGVYGFRYRAKHGDTDLGSKESKLEAELLCRDHQKQATAAAFKASWTQDNGVWVHEGRR